MTGWFALQTIFGYLLVAILASSVGWYVGRDRGTQETYHYFMTEEQQSEEEKAEAERQQRIKDMSGS